MKPDAYPAQEPLPDFAKSYHKKLINRAEELGGTEQFYGDDPYQSLVYFPAE